MRWPWQSERIVYVPVPAHGAHAELWENPTYLAEVKNLADTRAWVAEITELIRNMREVADNSEHPERLKGANLCISLAKQLLVLSFMASAQMQNIKARSEIERAEGAGV